MDGSGAWLVAGLGIPDPLTSERGTIWGFLAMERLAERNGIRLSGPKPEQWWERANLRDGGCPCEASDVHESEWYVGAATG